MLKSINIIFIPILSIFLLFSFYESIHAEEPKKEQAPKRQTILDFKDELKLSNTQVKEIENLLTEFKKRQTDAAKEIRKHDAKLRELLQKDGDIAEIRKEVKEIYRLRGEMVIDELETARKIDGVLNPEQKKKWKEIRARGNKRQ